MRRLLGESSRRRPLDWLAGDAMSPRSVASGNQPLPPIVPPPPGDDPDADPDAPGPADPEPIGDPPIPIPVPGPSAPPPLHVAG